MRLAGDQAARDHGAGDQAARDHDVARAALDDAALDDAAIDHDLRARRNAGHHLLGALRITMVCGQHRRAAAQRAIQLVANLANLVGIIWNDAWITARRPL